jgi:hypothetical protein
MSGACACDSGWSGAACAVAVPTSPITQDGGSGDDGTAGITLTKEYFFTGTGNCTGASKISIEDITAECVSISGTSSKFTGTCKAAIEEVFASWDTECSGDSTKSPAVDFTSMIGQCLPGPFQYLKCFDGSPMCEVCDVKPGDADGRWAGSVCASVNNWFNSRDRHEVDDDAPTLLLPNDGAMCKKCCDQDPKSGCCGSTKDIAYIDMVSTTYDSWDCSGPGQQRTQWGDGTLWVALGCTGVPRDSSGGGNPASKDISGCSDLTGIAATYATTDCTGPTTGGGGDFPGFNKCISGRGASPSSASVSCTEHGGGAGGGAGGGGGAKLTGTITGVTIATIAAVVIAIGVRRRIVNKKRLADPLLGSAACASCGVTYLVADATLCHACSAPR